MRTAVTLLGLCTVSVGHSALARNYALVVGGSVRADPEKTQTISHDFSTGLFKMTAGLIRSGYETNVVFSPQQGKTTFNETKAIQNLSKQDNQPKFSPGTRAGFFDAVKNIEKKVGDGDKVILHVQGHGSNYHEKDQSEGWMFCLHNPAERFGYCDPVQDREITDAVRRLQAGGARVAVVLDSCHSGSFRPELARSLREPPDGRPPACLITSSLNNQASEACMGADYDGKGKLLNPQNQSATSAVGFFHNWIHWRSHGSGPDPMGKDGNPCWNDEGGHFQRCLGTAKSKGIKVTEDSSLKDVLRAGRLCDGSSTFLDSTGKGTENSLLALLQEPSLSFLYGEPAPGAPPQPISPDHSAHTLTNLEIALERPVGAGATPYEKNLRERATSTLTKYRDNLTQQRKLLSGYNDTLKAAISKEAIRARLGNRVEAVNARFAADHRRNFPGTPRPGESFPPASTVDTAHRLDLIFVLLRLTAAPETPAGDGEIYQDVASRLQGGAEGMRALRELQALQGLQNERYREILQWEREIYENTLGQTRDSCSDFTL